METWQSLILGLCGIGFIGDIVLHFVLPSRKRKDYAETELAEHDADKAEVERLHMQIDHQQKSLDKYLDIEKDLSERISEQNKALNEKEGQIRDKTDQIRTDLTDGDSDKEGNLAVVRGTKCAACLTENLFQDNREDVEYLLSPEGREAIIKLHVEGIKAYVAKYGTH